MAICGHYGVEPTKLDTDDWDNVERVLKGVMKNARNVVPESAQQIKEEGMAD